MFYHVCRRHQSGRFSTKNVLFFFFPIAFLLLIYFSLVLLFDLDYMCKGELCGDIFHFQIPCSMQREFQNNETLFVTVKKYVSTYIQA